MKNPTLAATPNLPRIPFGTVLFIALMANASALNFNFTFTPTSSPEDIAGFTAAGAFWSSKFSNDITLNMNVGTGALGAGILASANSSRDVFSYGAVRTALVGNATSATDHQAVGSLATTPSFGMLINRTSNNPNGSGSATAYHDNNEGLNNSEIRMTTANAKALGLIVPPDENDADITFGNAFSWDYDSSDGITPGAFDFVGIAIHELGHALGFTSGVDILDINSPPINGPFSDDQFNYVSTLDLFRYSAASTALGVIDWTASDAKKYFSLDNGVTEIAQFSTGKNFGDGSQASHWKDDLNLGIMDPTSASGETLSVSQNDLTAFDAIGWNLIPEPSTALLGVMGLLLTLQRRR